MDVERGRYNKNKEEIYQNRNIRIERFGGFFMLYSFFLQIYLKNILEKNKAVI